VYGTAVLLGQNKREVLVALSSAKTVEGRFDIVSGDDNITAVIDYAHTPDALANIIGTINDIREGRGQLITVAGAGGDRDTSKRAEMAYIASKLSDRLILTSDNPRSENPEAIIDMMMEGVEITKKRNVLRVTNRKEAIKTASALAQEGDIILITGKGHEKYQEINGVKYPFDDKAIIQSVLNSEN
jgi:UDP-N-acetylmuramoyl-L-alanyl-D-glutamate--2,6-diaminopimelate ligase